MVGIGGVFVTLSVVVDEGELDVVDGDEKEDVAEVVVGDEKEDVVEVEGRGVGWLDVVEEEGLVNAVVVGVQFGSSGEIQRASPPSSMHTWQEPQTSSLHVEGKPKCVVVPSKEVVVLDEETKEE